MTYEMEIWSLIYQNGGQEMTPNLREWINQSLIPSLNPSLSLSLLPSLPLSLHPSRFLPPSLPPSISCSLLVPLPPSHPPSLSPSLSRPLFLSFNYHLSRHLPLHIFQTPGVHGTYHNITSILEATPPVIKTTKQLQYAWATSISLKNNFLKTTANNKM